jgi:hypothetical protein
MIEENVSAEAEFKDVQPYRAAAIRNRAISAENLPKHLDKVSATVAEIMRVEASISRSLLNKWVGSVREWIGEALRGEAARIL